MQTRRYFLISCFAQRVRSSSKKPHNTKKSTMKDPRFRGLKRLTNEKRDIFVTIIIGMAFVSREKSLDGADLNSDQKLILFYK